MTEEIIVDGVNVVGCVFLNKANGFKHCYCTNEKDTLGDERNTRYGGCEYNTDCYYKQLKRLEQENKALIEENEEMHERLRTIIYNATGGRLSYSTYTVQAVEQAFYDQLEIETEQRTKELEEENKQLKEEIFIARENYGLEMEFQNMYREALEEIRNYLNTLSGVDGDFTNIETYLRIQYKINEVLKDE